MAIALRRAAAYALASLLLGGCAQLETRPAREAEVDLAGRLAARYGEESFTGSIAWRHAKDFDEMLITTPLGQGVARIVREGDQVALTTAEPREYHAADVESLTQQVLGFRLPLDGLADWVRGRPSPDLERRGWKIEYQEYAGEFPARSRVAARKAPPGRRRARRRLVGCGDGPAGPQSPLGSQSRPGEAARNRPAARGRRAVFHLWAQRRRRRHWRAPARTRAAGGLVPRAHAASLGFDEGNVRFGVDSGYETTQNTALFLGTGAKRSRAGRHRSLSRNCGAAGVAQEPMPAGAHDGLRGLRIRRVRDEGAGGRGSIPVAGGDERVRGAGARASPAP